jgi:hypothetical protein
MPRENGMAHSPIDYDYYRNRAALLRARAQAAAFRGLVRRAARLWSRTARWARQSARKRRTASSFHSSPAPGRSGISA